MKNSTGSSMLRACFISFPMIILTSSLFFTGTFHAYLSCALSTAILIWFIVRSIRLKKPTLRKNLVSFSLAFIVIWYGVNALWAVDPGMAIIGFMKFLPVPLFFIALTQDSDTERIIEALPCIAAVLTVLSAILMQIPSLSDFFSVAGRLAGTFQYPNTFALFLLTAELIVITKEKITPTSIVLFAILFLGILYTGSRTVFLLAAASNLAAVFFGKNRKRKIILFVGLILAVAAAAVYAVVSGNVSGFGRFITISLSESTFVGRLLYARDALLLILRHPFGLGYMGYYYMQQSVQTGLYSVMYVHNDILQLLLDIGWIPTGIFLCAWLKAIFRKNAGFRKRLVLSVVFVHCLFDFNLQFIGMFFVLVLFLSDEPGKDAAVKSKAAVGTFAVILAAVSLYFGISLGFERFGLSAAAHAMYPLNTQNETSIMISLSESDAVAAENIADDILSRNEHVTAAYSVKAHSAYSDGDFGSLILYKNKIFENAPFACEEYREYFYMLINGIALYNQAGDPDSAAICEKELVAAAEKLQNLSQRLSHLGILIKDQPETYIPEDVQNYLNEMEGTAVK